MNDKPGLRIKLKNPAAAKAIVRGAFRESVEAFERLIVNRGSKWRTIDRQTAELAREMAKLTSRLRLLADEVRELRS